MPTSFPEFSRLPPEIRLMVWRYTFPGPRILHLKNTLQFSRIHSRKRRRRLCHPTINLPAIILILLRLCRESRYAVLSQYEALFKPTSPRDTYYRLHYLDPLKDGIFIDDLNPGWVWPWARNVNQPGGIYNVRKLSIGCNAWWNLWKHAIFRETLLGQEGLLRFKHLEELHIVFRILTEHERQNSSPVYLCTQMANRVSSRISEIDFPRPDVDIRAEPIVQSFQSMVKTCPEWNVPKLKIVAWGARPTTATYATY